MSVRSFSNPLFGFGAALCLGLLTGVLLLALLGEQYELKRSNSYTYVVLNQIDQLTQNINAAEMGEHLYIETGNKRFLKSYTDMIGDDPQHAAVEEDIERLKNLVADEPEQRHRLEQLEAAMQEKIAMMDNVAGIVQTQLPVAAQVVAQIEKDEILTDRVRGILALMENSAHEEWAVTDGRNEKIVLTNTLTLGGFFAVFLAVVAGSFLAMRRNIAERNEMEATKDEFIATVSHELRTPLTSIRGSLGLILERMHDRMDDKPLKLINLAHKNTERLTRIIDNLLDIEKIGSGELEFNIRPLNLGKLLQQVADENQGFASRYGVRIELMMEREDAVIEGDADRLQQVLANLLSNAIKFSPNGETVILTCGHHGGEVVMSVTDHGPGIPAAFQPRIFMKFAQAEASEPRKMEGSSGLGLAISKALVLSMGGRIGFESRLGRTVFHITFRDAAAPRPETKKTPQAKFGVSGQEAA